MSTSEMLSKLSTWTSTPTGMAGPDHRSETQVSMLRLKADLYLTAFICFIEKLMEETTQSLIKSNEIVSDRKWNSKSCLWRGELYSCSRVHSNSLFRRTSQGLVDPLVHHRGVAFLTKGYFQQWKWCGQKSKPFWPTGKPWIWFWHGHVKWAQSHTYNCSSEDSDADRPELIYREDDKWIRHSWSPRTTSSPLPSLLPMFSFSIKSVPLC